jgi:hypothetical protein
MNLKKTKTLINSINNFKYLNNFIFVEFIVQRTPFVFNKDRTLTKFKNNY